LNSNELEKYLFHHQTQYPRLQLRTGYSISNSDVYQACGEACIECEKPRHKKARHKTGLSISW
jgi:hypothetical protein